MRTVKFADVRSNIIESMRKRMLIPIIGSGFTRGCNSLYGTVPSGEDYRNHMIKAIESTGTLKPDENKVLQSETFSAISSVYHAEVPVEKQHKYHGDHYRRERAANVHEPHPLVSLDKTAALFPAPPRQRWQRSVP